MSTAAAKTVAPETSAAPVAKRTTTRGTPCAQAWDDTWISQVEAREQEMNSRICGARTLGGRPCPLPSDHASGRCPHHGGAALTGAPPGNRNAVLHGLYARRLAPASPPPDVRPGLTVGLGSGPGSTPGGTSFQHVQNQPGAPLAQSPARNPRPTALAEADRAVCPFELALYNALVTDLMKRTCANPQNAFGLHLAHQVALLTVMVSRAARALAPRALTDTLESYQAEHLVLTDRPAAALLAFEKLSRELRMWTQLLEKNYPADAEVDPATALEHERRTQYDTRVDTDGLAALDLAGTLARKEHASRTPPPNPKLDEIDFRIVDKLFTRAGVTPQTPDPAITEIVRRQIGISNGGPARVTSDIGRERR